MRTDRVEEKSLTSLISKMLKLSKVTLWQDLVSHRRNTTINRLKPIREDRTTRTSTINL